MIINKKATFEKVAFLLDHCFLFGFDQDVTIKGFEH